MTNTAPDPNDSARIIEYLVGERETSLLKEVVAMRSEVAATRSEVARLRAEVERVAYGHASNASSIRAQQLQINNLPLHRQLRRLPGRAVKSARRRARVLRRRAADPDEVGGPRPAELPVFDLQPLSGAVLLVLAHAYPVGGLTYGGQPLERRVAHYVAAGHDVVVFVPLRPGMAALDTRDAKGVRVIVAPLTEFAAVGSQLAPSQLAIHSPTPELWEAARCLSGNIPTHVWIHGFEARNWRDLSFDFTATEIVERGEALDGVNLARQKTLREIFLDADCTKVFVSNYMRSVAERFAGVGAVNGVVIHNVIDHDRFPYWPKRAEQRRRVVMVRNFDRRNYGTDLATLALMHLARQPIFRELEVRIIGDGRYFVSDTAPLLGFGNVSLERGFVDADRLAGVLAWGGIALLPTRWDSQGMMMGEAMMSGLVPVTNGVSAIPEFVDATCAKLAPADDFELLAAGIAELAGDEQEFLAMSSAAHDRVLAQCGPDVTVQRELDLLGRPGTA